MPALQVRAAFATWNNPDGVIEWPEYVRYGVYQLEEGVECHTPHYHVYAEFSKLVTFAKLKAWLPKAHWEQRKGTRDEARAYCMKDETRVDGPWEHGTWETCQGKRSDLDRAIATTKANVGRPRAMKAVAEEHPREFVKCHKGLMAYANELIPDRTEPPEVRVFYGPTGCGKSRAAREWLGAIIKDKYGVEDPPEHWEPSMGQWFDGYMGQTEFLMEEFRGQLTVGQMLSLLDRYTAKVQVKGQVMRFVATKIAITSPVHPREWYNNEGNDNREAQLMRRITAVMDMGSAALDI